MSKMQGNGIEVRKSNVKPRPVADGIK